MLSICAKLSISACSKLPLVIVLVCCCVIPGLAQGLLSGRIEPEEWNKRLADDEARFYSGRGAAVLTMMWYSDPYSVTRYMDPSGHATVKLLYSAHYCQISSNGLVLATGFPVNNRLDGSNIQRVVELFRKMPPAPKEKLAYEQQLIVAGPRGDKWYSAIYDLSDLPKEIKEIYKITGADLKITPKKP